MRAAEDDVELCVRAVVVIAVGAGCVVVFLWMLQRSFSASGAMMLRYMNFAGVGSQLDCISETVAWMSDSGTRDPTGIIVTYFSESSENNNTDAQTQWLTDWGLKASECVEFNAPPDTI